MLSPALKIATATRTRAAATFGIGAGTGGTVLGYTSARLRSFGGSAGGAADTLNLALVAAAIGGGYLLLEELEVLD